jgi:hypothetical protein
MDITIPQMALMRLGEMRVQLDFYSGLTVGRKVLLQGVYLGMQKEWCCDNN